MKTNWKQIVVVVFAVAGGVGLSVAASKHSTKPISKATATMSELSMDHAMATGADMANTMSTSMVQPAMMPSMSSATMVDEAMMSVEPKM